MQIKTLLSIAFGSLLLVACSEEYLFIPVGTATQNCPPDAYCLDVTELTVSTAYYNLTTVSDTRGPDPDAYYQVVT